MKMVPSLDKLLSLSAQKYSKKIALKEKDSPCTYQELDSYSEKIASYLLSLGLKPNQRVGLYIHKSIKGIAAIFGIFKAGGVYVPLDINWAPKRCSWIIDNCQIQYLFSHSLYANRLNEIGKRSHSLKKIILLDSHFQQIQSTPTLQALCPMNKNNLAFILYTSGSTGEPKGVMTTHQAQIKSVQCLINAYHPTNKDRFLLYHPFSFAASGFEIFLPLKCGARLSILPEGISAFVPSLVKFIKQERITILHLTPHVLVQLVLYGNLAKDELPDLKKIIFVGSKIPLRYLRSLMKSLPQVRFFNEYASTETRIVTYYPVKKIPSEKELFLPIGKPCRLVKTYLINEVGKRLPVKPGVQGELYVDSPSLMSGYWDDPEAARGVLLKNPFTRKERMLYRTHDIVRVDKDKNFIFLGRSDNVIKARGYRVSLDEIESVLNNHPAIKEVVVLSIPDEETGSRIKAVVVLKKEKSLSKKEINLFCRNYLANYMVPQIIEFRPSLPKTTSGKINKKALIA